MAEPEIDYVAIFEIIRQILTMYMRNLLILTILVRNRANRKRNYSAITTKSYSMIERFPAQIKHLTRMIGTTNVDCMNNLRMDRNSFGRLCLLLRELGSVKDSKYVTVEEQVALFLGVLTSWAPTNVKRYGPNSDGPPDKLPNKVIEAVMDGCRYSKLKCVGGSNSGGVDSIIELSDDNGVDRISELPDEIIIFILSFLSLREAICTSGLSSRWPALWKYIPSIKFNTKLIKTRPRMEMPWELRSCDMEKTCEEYIQMVNSVLRSREALSLKEFRLSLYVDKSAECSVARWLEYLFSRQVEILELDFLCQYKMDKVCLGASLRDTKLCLPLTDVVLFKSLKRLCLKSLKASGEDIDLFLCNCPLLEQMSIHKTHLTSDVVLIGTTLMLKHLDIYRCTGHFSVIIFSSPKLTWLRVDTQSNNNLVLANVPKLIRADFTIRSRTLDDAQDFASAVFCYISRLKFLHLSLDHPKVFLWNGFPQMPKLKRLSIRYSGVYGHGLMPITALIWASPRLKEFNLEFINLARDPTRWGENFTNDTRPPHRHLKTFKFKGFCEDAADHIELVTYISNNCVVLQNIFIS